VNFTIRGWGGRGSWHGLCARRAPTIKRWSLDARSGDHANRLAECLVLAEVTAGKETGSCLTLYHVPSDRPDPEPSSAAGSYSSKPLRGAPTSSYTKPESPASLSGRAAAHDVGLRLSRHLGEHPVSRHDSNDAGFVPPGSLVGSHRRFPFELRSELAAVPCETGADVVVFPWSLVSMSGACYWGWLARQSGFQKYLRTGRSSALSNT
jgi:hypothetical protein